MELSRANRNKDENSATTTQIQDIAMKYKYHIIFTLIVSVIVVAVIFIAPSFVTILAYFWPLFLSTALFLVAVIFFGRTSLPAETEVSGEKVAGEGLLDYVAGSRHVAGDVDGDLHQGVENFKNE